MSHGLIKQALSQALAVDNDIVNVLLEKEKVLHAETSKFALVADFLELNGLAASYFNNETLTEPAALRRIDTTINFNWGGTKAAPEVDADHFSVRWDGKILPQFSEEYTFQVSVDDGVRLWVDGKLLINEWQSQQADYSASTSRLEAGKLYDIKLEYYDHELDGRVELSWSSSSTPKEIIPKSQLFSARAVAAYERLHKIAMLVNGFKLSAPEIEYWYSSDFAKLDLNSLPLSAIDKPTVFEQWQKLAEYISLRDLLPNGIISLMDVLKSEANLKSGILADLTGWRKSDIEAARDALKLQDKDLNIVANLLKIHKVIQLSLISGIGIKQLNAWATNAPDPGQAKEVKNSVKARYDEESWLQVSKPLSDKLRESQRSALIAYVLAKPEIRRANVTNSNRLFEYFLIDVEMGACMVTSRIKQAISSVQLFVQRCLLNLEPGVSPSVINADRWQWMKNYRVWEANRKVFLYPENWIQPELRDDKSPFFKQMESELLQNDVTNESAEKALLSYLYKLDQVARLEVCGMYLQEGFEAWEEYQSILHVIPRTRGGVTHSYYYRRLIDNETWTPWEKVELDINGMQGSDSGFSDGINLLPVVWNRRLYLFWLVLTLKAQAEMLGDGLPQ